MRPHIYAFIMACEQWAEHTEAGIVVDSVAMPDELVVHGEVMGFVLAADEGISSD